MGSLAKAETWQRCGTDKPHHGDEPECSAACGLGPQAGPPSHNGNSGWPTSRSAPNQRPSLRPISIVQRRPAAAFPGRHNVPFGARRRKPVRRSAADHIGGSVRARCDGLRYGPERFGAHR